MSLKKPRILLVYCSEVKKNNAFPIVAPIGLLFINGYLVEKGYETKIINIYTVIGNKTMIESDEYKNEIRKSIEEFCPDYIGISFRNVFHNGLELKKSVIDYLSVSEEKKVIEFIRTLTDADIIGGGSAFSLQPALYMRYLGLNYGIIGEGEVSFEKLIQCLNAKSDVCQVPGLVYWNNNRIIINQNEFINNLDSMPNIKIDENLDYKGIFYDQGGYANVQTKRGCCFECIYCTYPFLEGSNYRLRDIKKVIGEIKYINERYDINRFFIVDSVFSTPVDHSVNFCKEHLSSNMQIKWSAYVNPRGLSKEVLDIYKASGCEHLFFTPDTLSDTVLKEYRKGFTIDDVANSVHILKESNIPFSIDCILGGPGEDEHTVDETLEFYDKHLKGVNLGFSVGMWLHFNIPEINYVLPDELLLNNTCENRNVSLNRLIDINPICGEDRKDLFNNLVYFFPHIKDDRENRLITIFKKVLLAGHGMVSDDPIINNLIRKARLRIVKESMKCNKL